MSSIQKKGEEQRSLVAALAQRFEMEPQKFWATVKKVIDPQNKVSAEEMAVFLLVAKEHNLNPLTGEMWLLPTRSGPKAVVSIDGWLKIMNSHPQFDGLSYEDNINDQGKLISVTCRIYRKDRRHSIECTEYMDECHRGNDVWKKYGKRMLRHKATIQAARLAFSFANILDPDEAGRFEDSGAGKQIKPAVNVDYTDTSYIENEPGGPGDVIEVNELPPDAGGTDGNPIEEEPPAEPEPDYADTQSGIKLTRDDVEDMELDQLRAIASKFELIEDAEKRRSSTLRPLVMEHYFGSDEPEQEPEQVEEAAPEPDEEPEPRDVTPPSNGGGLFDEPSNEPEPVEASSDQVSDEDIPGSAEGEPEPVNVRDQLSSTLDRMRREYAGE